jgi:sulfoxide reductase heme-binding subunit YedZ
MTATIQSGAARHARAGSRGENRPAGDARSATVRAPRGPWRDPTGRLSPLKIVVFAGLFVPGLVLLWRQWAGDLGPRPIVELTHVTGRWTIYFLLATLAISPARRLLRWPQLIWVRRMLGLAAAAYACAHLLLYIVDMEGDLGVVATEIASRYYLTIGFIAVLGLVPLAVTSTNAMVRRLGPVRWGRLQSLVYPIAILAIVHFFMQTKADLRLPLITGGLLAWLLLYRIAARMPALAALWNGRWSLAATLGLGVVAAGGVALSEALYYWALRGAPIGRVLEANLSITPAPRSAVVVLAVGLAVLLASAIGRWVKGRDGRRHAPSATISR